MRSYIRIIAAALCIAIAAMLCSCGTTSDSIASASDGNASVSDTPRTVTINMHKEGEIESKEVPIISGCVGSYTIGFDPEHFAFDALDDMDLYRCTTWDGDPTAYMSVSFYEDCAADAVIANIPEQLDGMEYESGEAVVGGYNALSITAYDRELVRIFYAIGDGDDCYLLEAQYISEMSEGFGVEMLALFDTFAIAE